jgi:hypothetical protein
MDTFYLIIELEEGKGNILYQVYSLDEAKNAIKIANESSDWRGVYKKHIYIPVKINTLSLSTPPLFREKGE